MASSREIADHFKEEGESSKGAGGSQDSESKSLGVGFGSLETEPDSVGEAENSGDEPFGELSIQWLNMAKVKKLFREALQTSENEYDNCKIIMQKIIEVHNNKQKNLKWSRNYLEKKTWDETKYFMRSYSYVSEIESTRMARLAKNVKEHSKKNAYFLVFYFQKNTHPQIIALSSDKAFSVVKPYIDHTFPFIMAEKVADFDQIRWLARSSIVGKGLKEALLKPTKLDLCKTSNFYYIIDHFVCTINKYSHLWFVTSKLFDGKNVSIKFSSSGFLKILEKLTREGYLLILRLLEKYMEKAKKTSRGREETKYRAFEFLYNIRPSRFCKEDLDKALAETMFEQHQQGHKLLYHVHHKYLEDLLFSSDVEVKIGSEHFRQLARTPEIEDIIKMIGAEDKVTFINKITEGKLRFTDRKSQTHTKAIIDFIEGQFCYQGQETCFKIRKMWYEVRAEYLSLLNEDFRAVLQKTLIREGEDNGQLERGWITNEKSKSQITQEILKDKLNLTEKDALNLLSTLTKLKVCYVSANKCINQRTLHGEILESAEIQKHKDAIEQILSNPEYQLNFETQIKKVCSKDATKVLNELRKKRSVLKKTKQGMYVLHPFAYQFKEMPIYVQLSALLGLLYEVYTKEQKTYNTQPEGSCSKKDTSKYFLTQQILQASLNLTEDEAVKLLSDLEELKVSYVSTEYTINHQELIGEILNNSAVEDYRDSIEQILRDSANCSNLASKIKEVCKKKSNKVLGALKKKRNVLKITEEGTYVRNPFPYQLKEMPTYNLLSQLLVELYVPYIKEEETYNRLYVEDVDKGYLVFDQILPLHMEPCDILKYTNKTVYLYHVKAQFGQETREVCSQILNSATLFRNALSMRQSKNYLQNLYDICVNRVTSGNSWFERVKDEIVRLGLDGFTEIFRSNRNIVFVYAYVPEPNKSFYEESEKPSHITRKMLGLGDERLGKERLELLQQLRCLDSAGAGRLTNYFYSLTKEKFKEIAEDKLRREEDVVQIYDVLKSAEPFSVSTLAKMEVVRLAQNLASLGFDFKICEIGDW